MQVEAMTATKRQEMVERAWKKNWAWLQEKSSFYRDIMSEFITKDISLQDIAQLPLTTASQVQGSSWTRRLTGPLSTVTRVQKMGEFFHAYSLEDLSRQLDITIRSLAALDINKSSMVILCGDYATDAWLHLHYSVEALGGTVIPCSSVEQLQMMLEDIHPHYIIIDAQLQKEVSSLDCSNTIITIISAQDINTLGTIPQHAIVLVRELGVIGALFRCEQGRIHLQNDYFYPEIVEGELVLTPLYYQAMPMARVATGIKAVNLVDDLCSCGRSLIQLVLSNNNFV